MFDDKLIVLTSEFWKDRLCKSTCVLQTVEVFSTSTNAVAVQRRLADHQNSVRHVKHLKEHERSRRALASQGHTNEAGPYGTEVRPFSKSERSMKKKVSDPVKGQKLIYKRSQQRTSSAVMPLTSGSSRTSGSSSSTSSLRGG